MGDGASPNVENVEQAGHGNRRIGIALSGGGSRAIAFHLGCLRALNDLNVLQRARVLSTVSGGSVIGAMYATHEGTFEEFEHKVRRVLADGFLRPALRKVVTTTEGAKALLGACTSMVAWAWLVPFRIAAVRPCPSRLPN